MQVFQAGARRHDPELEVDIVVRQAVGDDGVEEIQIVRVHSNT